jgi:hypothetical protein
MASKRSLSKEAQVQRRKHMAEPATGASRPGVSVGPTSEFSLFFRVKPGHGDALREALRALQTHPGYRPGEYHMAIATIHEARFVLFDDDTRLLFATSVDGSLARSVRRPTVATSLAYRILLGQAVPASG